MTSVWTDSANKATAPPSGRVDLFLISVLLLFLELACIRWFPAHVLFLTFLTNTVLLACFLGMSLGCLAAHHRREYLRATPILLGIAILAGTAMDGLHSSLAQVVAMGDQQTPQMVYFGTEYHAADLARFAIPIEVIVVAFFLLITLLMVGPGQVLGRALKAVPNRLQAYTLNILGSIVGIVLFAGCSWLQLAPVWWFLPIAAGLLWFLARRGPQPLRGLAQPQTGQPGGPMRLARSSWLAWAPLAAALLLPGLVLLPGTLRANFARVQRETYWSPYYRINYGGPPDRSIAVNLVGHQVMIGQDEPYPAYALPHLLHRDSGGKPFQDVLIIGGGSGNDVSRALTWGTDQMSVDVVEIDPVIYSLGQRDHPDRPYQDPRVRVILDDGRNYLRSTEKKYDLVIFALVDSLVLHSSYSNIRLESYLFTRQAFADVRRCLKPEGTFAVYNLFRQGWIVSRLAQTVQQTFGAPPVVLSLPPQDVVHPDAQASGFTLCLAGSGAEPIRRAFDRHGEYWLPANTPPRPDLPNGFTSPTSDKRLQRETDPGWLQFRLSRVEQPAEPIAVATDDWPFLYLRRPMIPDLSLRGMLLLGGLSLALLFLFAPRQQEPGAQTMGKGRWAFDGRMFFLGAGFLLIETKAVVHMALLFGSTWMVNSIVFFAVLVMILAANLFVLWRQPQRLLPWYVGLALALALNVLVPLDFFLGLSRPVQVGGACLLVFAPILFAGVIFAVSFARVEQPDRSFGYNIAGAMLGGLAEYTSMLVGFQYLVLAALGCYALSACWPTAKPATVQRSQHAAAA